MDSIPAIFGQSLPGPAHIQAVWGTREGEVCFIIHPNGDIQAHQWSKNESSWRNIGQYSYNRKGVEGILKSEQLKGQKIGHTMPRNTLEYFVAIAKQYEETSIAKASEPTGYEKGGVHARIRPAVPLAHHLHRPPPSVDTSGEASRSFSSAGFSSQKTGLPTMSSFVPDRSNRYEPRGSATDRFGNLNFGRITGSPSHATPSSSNTSPFTLRKSISPEAKRSFAANPQDSLASSQSGLFRCPGRQSTTDIESVTSKSFTFHLPTQPVNDLQVDKEKIFQQEQQRIQQNSLQFHRRVINEDSDGETDIDSVDQMKDVLLRQYLNAVETPTTSPGLRRVDEKKPSLDIARYVESSAYGYGDTKNFMTFSTAHPNQNPCHHNGQADGDQSAGDPLRTSLGHSDAEVDYYNRQVMIIDPKTPCITTAADLAEISRPTPQRWAGPFFTDGERDLRNHLTQDEKLNEWWTSGNKAHRLHEELLMHKKLQPQAPIGTKPNSLSNNIGSLLLPVRVTLQSYMDPAKGDYFSRFGPPPEHCIEDSPQGRQSFFREDHGAQPAKLEKDPRYRHLSLSSMGFEEQKRRPEIWRAFRSSLGEPSRSYLSRLGESSD
jgi:hypothetical protein